MVSQTTSSLLDLNDVCRKRERDIEKKGKKEEKESLGN
jgi:hypothetical protein